MSDDEPKHANGTGINIRISGADIRRAIGNLPWKWIALFVLFMFGGGTSNAFMNNVIAAWFPSQVEVTVPDVKTTMKSIVSNEMKPVMERLETHETAAWPAHPGGQEAMRVVNENIEELRDQFRVYIDQQTEKEDTQTEVLKSIEGILQGAALNAAERASSGPSTTPPGGN